METTRSASTFLTPDFEAAYLRLHRSGELTDRVQAALEELRECRACPRNCGVNRIAGASQFCRTGRHSAGNQSTS